jgi:DNA-3-methyladenine glycosylase II
MLEVHPLYPASSWFIQNCHYLGPWAAKLGPVNYPLRPGTYDVLVHSIISQQVSNKAAATIYNKLLVLLSGNILPEHVLALPPEAMQSLGISRQKQSYIYHLSECFISDKSRFTKLTSMSDHEVISLLTRIKGIGVWTAQMYLIFSLGRPDVFPADDLGVKMAIQRLMNLPAPPVRSEILQISERWKPWRSAAAWYLWQIPKT